LLKYTEQEAGSTGNSTGGLVSLTLKVNEFLMLYIYSDIAENRNFNLSSNLLVTKKYFKYSFLFFKETYKKEKYFSGQNVKMDYQTIGVNIS
jgi:hypothetical protein